MQFEELEEAIREAHGCDSEHVESVPVVEDLEGQGAWQGTVEVFRLIGHPRAKCAFAWSYPHGARTRCVTVLQIPPVDSPQSAVKVAIEAQSKKRGFKTEDKTAIRSRPD
jgi:hypothetical protein